MFANNNEPFRFTYSCYSLEDIIFSICHFHILHNYKFNFKINRCIHCGKYFATKTFKQKYCKGKSPYKGCELLNCEQAVRDVRQKLARQKKSICSLLYKSYDPSILHIFYDEYDEFIKSLGDCSSAENLNKLEQFLSKENRKQRWYKKEYLRKK